MSPYFDQFKALAVLTLRSLTAVGIAYLFMIVLMTASTQASITGALAQMKPKLEYSAGYAAWQLYRERADRIKVLRGLLVQARQSASSAEQARKEVEDSYYAALGPLEALVASFGPNNPCRLDGQVQFARIANILGTLRLCAIDVRVPEGQRKVISAYLEGSDDLRSTAARWSIKDRADAAMQRAVLEAERDLAAIEKVQEEAGPVAASFAELGVLENNWVVGVNALAKLPPSITQIILAFVAGLFGGLLLTLVLVVYPQNNLNLTSSGAGYGARILLGGLISVCVFVVLGGGTAVLGAGSAFAEGKVNYLAFCAIGILAGMFSDRVAYWLSTRADSFFVKDGNERPA